MMSLVNFGAAERILALLYHNRSVALKRPNGEPSTENQSPNVVFDQLAEMVSEEVGRTQ